MITNRSRAAPASASAYTGFNRTISQFFVCRASLDFRPDMDTKKGWREPRAISLFCSYHCYAQQALLHDGREQIERDPGVRSVVRFHRGGQCWSSQFFIC